MNLYWQPQDRIEAYINDYSTNSKKFSFVQIGANDGITGDPIYKFIRRDQWTGVLIEPVSYLFEQLKSTYQNINTHLHFENIAVAKEKGWKDFYYIEDYTPDETLPVWLKLLGSFNKDHLSSLEEKYGVIIKSMKVPCDTVNSILEKYNLFNLDLLHIDTEGYDFEIIQSIDFSKFRPKMIFYEHRHLNNEDKILCLSFLRRERYSIVEGKYDNLSVANYT